MRLFIILAVCITLANGRLKLNLNIPKCNRRDPKLVACLLNSVELMRPQLITGIPEVNIPRLEPFKMKELELDAELPGLYLKGEASNIVAYGASKFQIKSLKVNMEDFFVDVHVHIPKLEVTADYDSTGSKVYTFEASGSGQFKGIFTDVDAVVKGKGHPITKNGKEYVKIDEVNTIVKLGKSQLTVDPDNQTKKARLTAKFLSSNADKILRKIAPVVSKAAAPIIQKYISKILNVVPLDDILS